MGEFWYDIEENMTGNKRSREEKRREEKRREEILRGKKIEEGIIARWQWFRNFLLGK